jgi:lipoprotein-anchoring transpeptidase ErfK/SrfK
VEVHADLSEHRLEVLRDGRVLFRARAATGAPSSPTPPGRYFVTDRVAMPQGGAFGTFAFGLSGIQTNLPAGWTGGDQLAIHGTNDPGSIGTSASAGCLRVSERILDRLRPLLRLGTPVVIAP